MGENYTTLLPLFGAYVWCIGCIFIAVVLIANLNLVNDNECYLVDETGLALGKSAHSSHPMVESGEDHRARKITGGGGRVKQESEREASHCSQRQSRLRHESAWCQWLKHAAHARGNRAKMDTSGSKEAGGR